MPDSMNRSGRNENEQNTRPTNPCAKHLINGERRPNTLHDRSPTFTTERNSW